ncbi:MAG TPA: hypothetical protein VHW01_09595 [Polyangiaceae bacterium]|jgi:hypothetical protein|nr:hypothetical protein [Polyangiaceae bacterium]
MNPLLLGATALGGAAAALGLGYRARVRGPFEATRYVWSRGLALLCDHNGGVGFVKGQRGGRTALRFDPALFDQVRDGDLIWMRLIALPQFIEEALPRIRARFALVTGDEDWAIPSGFARSSELLADSRVACWFTQNFDGTVQHDKLFPLPIGIDFHTISNRRKWGHWPATPAAQEAELEALRASALPNAQRLLRVHADFHFNKHKQQVWGDNRAAVQRALEGNPSVQFQTTKMRRIELWREKTRYAFVVSPHGNGLDCHRTWESLVLGNIVIVKRSSLDPLYEGLPVVIVDDWLEITNDNLRRWHSRYGAAFERADVQEKLTNRYWIERMRMIVAERLE